MKKIVGIATMPQRLPMLLDVIHSLAPQVDTMYVWLNGHKEIPDVPYDNVIFHHSQTNDGDMAKMHILEMIDKDEEFYYFTVDDDIVYPPDYVQHNIDVYEPGTIQSSHCNKYASFPIEDFTKSDISGYYFGANIPAKDRVHLIGTGVAMMDSTVVRQIPYDTFVTNNMLDLWISSWAWVNEIPMYVVPHKQWWLHDHPLVNKQDTIWNEVLRDCSRETQIINTYYS